MPSSPVGGAAVVAIGLGSSVAIVGAILLRRWRRSNSRSEKSTEETGRRDGGGGRARVGPDEVGVNEQADSSAARSSGRKGFRRPKDGDQLLGTQAERSDDANGSDGAFGRRPGGNVSGIALSTLEAGQQVPRSEAQSSTRNASTILLAPRPKPTKAAAIDLPEPPVEEEEPVAAAAAGPLQGWRQQIDVDDLD